MVTCTQPVTSGAVASALSGIKATLIQKQDTGQKSTSFVYYNSCAITVPPNKFYIATVEGIYNNSAVAKIGIGNKDTTDPNFSCYGIYNNTGNNYVHYPRLTFMGPSDGGVTLVPYGSWIGATENRIVLTVVYFDYA